MFPVGGDLLAVGVRGNTFGAWRKIGQNGWQSAGQFGRDEPHVPEERGLAFYDAARAPKHIRWYDCGHGLNAQAAEDRVVWLCEQLQLSRGTGD